MTLSSPMLTPGPTMTQPPRHTLFPMLIGGATPSLSRRGGGSMGWVDVSSWTFGATWQSSLR